MMYFTKFKKSGFVARPNPVSNIHVKARMMPCKHVLDYRIVYSSFFFQYFKDFVLEGLFEVFGMETGSDDVGSVRNKVFVVDDSGKVGGRGLKSHPVYAP